MCGSASAVFTAGEFFLFVGTGDPRKNFDAIPKALKAAKLPVPLVVAGWSGWLKKRACYDNVLCLGYIRDEELACLYSAAQALVFPSIYEGFGLPVLEAMACGCPVVTTKCASLPEVGGDAAVYLEDPYNVEELAEVLAGFAEGKYNTSEIREKGLAHAKRFSWDLTAQKTATIFDLLTNTCLR